MAISSCSRSIIEILIVLLRGRIVSLITALYRFPSRGDNFTKSIRKYPLHSLWVKWLQLPSPLVYFFFTTKWDEAGKRGWTRHDNSTRVQGMSLSEGRYEKGRAEKNLASGTVMSNQETRWRLSSWFGFGAIPLVRSGSDWLNSSIGFFHCVEIVVSAV